VSERRDNSDMRSPDMRPRAGARGDEARPPRLARGLLRRVLPRDVRDGAVEELDDKFHEYAAALPGSNWARRWYWRQVLGSLHPRLWQRSAITISEKGRRPLISDWFQDVRFGAKMLAKTPGVTAAILITLAVGIGFNGAVFSLLNTIIRNELPLDEPQEILFISSTDLAEGRDRMRVSYPDYRDLAAANGSFDALAAWGGISINLSDRASVPERLVGSWVTPSMFDVLRIEPLMGRRLRASDAETGAEPVGVMGHGLWQTRYGGDPDIVGRVIQVNGAPVTVVGVLPALLEQTPFNPELWTPLMRTEERETQRDRRVLSVVGRLREGATQDEAGAELSQQAARIAFENPEDNEGVDAIAQTFTQRFAGDANRAIVWILMGAVGVLLLIACANVANLLIARSLERSREVSIRSALGASRWRVMRQLLVEALLLSVAGGVAAVALAVWGARALETAIMNAAPPVFWDFSIQPSMYLFIGVVSIGTSLVFGLAPAMHATRVNVTDTLKDGVRGSSAGGARRLTSGLVVVQLIFSVVLLASAGVMVRSTRNVLNVDWAIDPDNVLTMGLSLPEADYPETDNIVAFHDELEQRIADLPGIESYALASTFPGEGGFTPTAEIEDLAVSEGNAEQILQQVIVSPSYFDMAATQAERGRLFTGADRFANDPVIVVERRLADRYWPGEDPIGKRLRWVGEEEKRWQTVVGVVPNIKQAPDIEIADDFPVVYTPYRQEPLRDMGIMVRAAMDTEVLATRLREEVQKTDANLPLHSIASLDEVIGQRTFGFRIISVLFLLLGGIALSLSCLGIYAVMAFAVGRRQQEIGIRVALGAQRSQVLGLVLRRAMWQMVGGLTIGLFAALAATRLLGQFMYEVSPQDPATFALTLALLIATALVACIVPARRASRVDPLEALRAD